MSQGDREPVAIIGVGCKFPGADNLEEFWSILENGENHVTEIPETRWFHESIYDPDFNTPAKTHARKAGLLKDHLAFDNKLFNIKDVEADIMDPQQRYVLECFHRALEDAGLTRDQLRGSNTCVFIGVMNTDYRNQFDSSSFVTDNYAVTGLASSVIANRVSYIYDLRGSSVTIDTACSSSLVAIDMGLHYLRAGACDMVVCGGVNSILTAEVFIHLSKARMVSAKGQCFAFSDQVDGYTRGEGCGVVILKRLQDAKRDKNKIWATIETGCNQDGGTVAPISKPSEEQQIKLLQTVWDRSRADPGDLVYIEAHGTGTPVGDVIEVNAIGKFLHGTHTGNTRYIGSVKTNIGHSESAAGVAGLIKVLLMMKHSKIVPSLHFQRPNPNIDFHGFHLKVATEVISWPELHKVASVTSCGFGGTNCYAIIESQGHNERAKPDIPSDNIVCFSAMNLESLKGSMKDFVNYPDVLSMNIEDLALTSTIHRDHFPVRQAFVANTTESLLSQVLDQITKVKHDSSDAKKPKIVFVFSGMGTDWPGMGRAYMSSSQAFRDKIRDIDTYLKEYVPWSVGDNLSTGLDTNHEMFWPVAIFACQVATAHLWGSLGVTPDCVVGYSVGEVAAAHVAGRLSLPEAVKVIYHRTRLLTRLAGVGRMILFKDVDIETVEKIVINWPGKANVSTKISPKACAVSGETDAISEIEKQVNDMAKNKNMTIQTVDLKLSVAYHSHCVDGCKEELRQVLDGTGLSQLETHTEMISTVTGDVVDGPLTAEYWVNNVREPVLFLDAVRKSFAEDVNTVYIEVGTKPVMAAHKKDIFPGHNAKVVVSMRSKADWKIFLEALGHAYKHGCSINWKNLPLTGQVITVVPRYSFTPRRVLRSSETASMTKVGIDYLRRQHPFVCNIESTDMFKVFLSAASFKSVFDHKVSGNLIIPGALYAEIAFAIGKLMQFKQAALYSVSATFEQPCRFSDKQPVIFNLDISKPQTGPSGSHLKSYTVAVMQHETLYATLHLHPFLAPRDHTVVNITQVKLRCPQTLDRQDIYKKLANFGFNYGPHYMLLQNASRNLDECIAYMTVPSTLFHEMPGTTVHPSILDAMIQTYVILTEDDSDKKEVLPISIGKLTSFRALEKEMCVYTIVKDSYGKSVIFDSTLTTMDGKIIVEMEDLTLKFLSAETRTNEDNTENIYRGYWVMKVPDYPYIKQIDQQILYMSNEITPPDVTSIEYSIDVDCSDTITQQLDILKRNNVLETFRCIVFNISFVFDQSVEASILQSKTINLCMVLKSVFCFPLKVPVYVFTRWAVPTEWSSSNKDNINPVMTAVWGMVRSALQERIADICLLDLHLEQEQCSLERLTSLANIVHKNNDLKRFPEWMVTENKMFVNEIIPLTNNIVPVFRHISADRHQHVLQVYNGPLGSTDTFCVYNESHNLDDKTDHMQISATESVVFHPHLFSRSVPYSTMVPHKGHLGSGNVVFALETTGTQAHASVQGCQREVIACYPSPIGSQISVPAAATLPRDLFDCYSYGDVTRLSVLMALSGYIDGSSVTILTSASTKGRLDKILYEMLAAKNSSPPTINITCLSLEELQNGQRLNRTVVSLVLLDSSLISVLMSHWPQAECLVTVTPLVSSRVKSLVNFYMPSVELIVMDPSEALQPRKLLSLVPRVKEFASSHRCLVSKCLAVENTLTDRFPEVRADLSDLLNIQTVKVNRSRVRVDHHFLFKKDAVYVVVGGLTGLGWITVRFLFSHGAGNIAIVNRRAPGKTKTREIKEMSLQAACNIQCFQCDVCDKDSFSNFLNVTAATVFPNKPLKGIFFGAAVEGDAILSNVTREHLQHVMSPKILGAWNAHILTEDQDLDYFVLQSSVTSVIGNFGQTSYGAANGFLDGLACYRRHRNLPGQSINWGPLTVGMMVDNEKAKQGLSQKGIQLLTEAEIQAVMNPILLLDFVQVIACNFDREKWKKNPLITTHGSASCEILLTEDLRRALQTAPQQPLQERIHIYMELLFGLAAQIIGIDKSLLQPDSTLLALGMDSLLAMTVRNEVFKVTQCRLPAVVLVSGDVTARILAETLDAEIQREVQDR